MGERGCSMRVEIGTAFEFPWDLKMFLWRWSSTWCQESVESVCVHSVLSWLNDLSELLANSSVLSRAREGKKSFCSHQQDIAEVLLFGQEQTWAVAISTVHAGWTWLFCIDLGCFLYCSASSAPDTSPLPSNSIAWFYLSLNNCFSLCSSGDECVFPALCFDNWTHS